MAYGSVIGEAIRDTYASTACVRRRSRRDATVASAGGERLKERDLRAIS
jgi:hypothetical protein